METKEETKQVYELIIIRHDNNHIIAIRSDNYDDCFETWKSLSDRWETAVVGKVPFRLTKPVITSIDPGLIKEITLRPVMRVPESKYDNPYQRRMMSEGLSGMMENINKGNPIDPNLLDEGYS